MTIYKINLKKPLILSVCLYALITQVSLVNAVTATVSQETNNTSTAFVDKLGREAINTLTNPSLDQSVIESQFLTLLNRDFNVSKIAQFVLGRYWKLATPAQKEQFTGLFLERLKKAYANRFKEYRGVAFTVKGNRDHGGYQIVNSIIQKPGGPEIQVEWWIKDDKINDVVVDGISMRTTLRDDYNSSIASHSGNLDLFLNDLQKRS